MKPKTKAKKTTVVSKVFEQAQGTALITQRNRASLEQQTLTLKQKVESITITNEPECQSARVVLTKIITAKGKAQNFINPILENAKEGLRLAKEQETTLVSPLKALEVTLRSTINAYLTGVMQREREQKEEQERKKREYEEKLARSKRPERIKAPEEIPEEEIVVVPVMESTAILMVPKYQVENESLIPEAYWKRELNIGRIWDEVRIAHWEKRECVIPGVRIWEEASLTIRGSR